MNTDKIYVIMWRGRDRDSDVWDDYPCYEYGWFEDKALAQNLCDELTKIIDSTDRVTNEPECFLVQEIQRGTEDTAKKAIQSCKNFYESTRN